MVEPLRRDLGRQAGKARPDDERRYLAAVRRSLALVGERRCRHYRLVPQTCNGLRVIMARAHSLRCPKCGSTWGSWLYICEMADEGRGGIDPCRRRARRSSNGCSLGQSPAHPPLRRSEERRVGKECRSRSAPHERKKL